MRPLTGVFTSVPRAPAGPRSSRRAFTLLEMVLVLGMAAMLLSSIYMSLSTGMRARGTIAAAVEPARAAAVAADLIRRDFEGVLNPNGIYAGPFIGYHQTGAGGVDMDMLEFHSLGSDGTGGDNPLSEGIRRIDFSVDQSTTPAVLVRRITRNLQSDVQHDPDEEVLCRGVKSFSIRYWDGADWLDQWDSTTMGDILPGAVEIMLELQTPPRYGETEPGSYSARQIILLPCSKASELPGLGGAGGAP